MYDIYKLTTTVQGGDRKIPMVTQTSSCRFAGDSMGQRNREPSRECATSVEFPFYRVSCMPTVGYKIGLRPTRTEGCKMGWRKFGQLQKQLEIIKDFSEAKLFC